MPDHADVLIIGAGAAGLAAAERLAQLGICSSLLEARDRIGGRIHTIHRAGDPMPLELGAEFVHGHPPQTWQIIRQANLLANEVTERHWQFRDGKLHDAARFWEQVDQVMAKLNADAPEQTFAQFIQSGCPDASDEVRQMALMFVEGFDAADANRITTVALAKDQAAADQIDESHNFRIIGGYWRIVDALAKRAAGACEIRLNTIVKKLHWQRGKVTATCVAGDGLDSVFVVTAPRAIVTLPVSLLQQSGDEGICFDPELPPKRDAARKLAMGPVVKILLQFREAFWDRHPIPSAGEDLPSLSFMHGRGEAFPTWWTQSPIASTLLTGWAGGPKADRLSHQPREVVLNRALDSLSRLFGMARREIDPLLQNWHIADWQADRFSRGAYSYVPVGAGNARKRLAEPIDDTLFFAGEATHYTGQTGTVAAALASGIRAAEEVGG